LALVVWWEREGFAERRQGSGLTTAAGAISAVGIGIIVCPVLWLGRLDQAAEPLLA